ncbi:MAG: GH1 family beta-glucosidase [Acidimicrobiia bacterium]
MKASDFPYGFLWGAATAAYQIEGAAHEGGRGLSIWDTFSHTEGKTLNGDTGDVAADHYNRFEEDVDILSELGVDAYRFSIAWSRILPEGTGAVNDDGVAFYRRLCESLQSAGITPVATLYHWDLPQALQDRGGWANRQSVDWFTNYAGIVYESLADVIPHIATFNEPWCTAFLGHSSGEHAPGTQDPGISYLVAHHLMLAHHAAVKRIRSLDPSQASSLSVVLNVIPAAAVSDSPRDLDVADSVDAVQNRLFLDAVFSGAYPEKVLDYHERFGVADVIDVDELASSVQTIDELGVNYYNINHFEFEEASPGMAAWPGVAGAVLARPPGKLTEMGWGVEPAGLTATLKRVHDDYGPIPMMVTENGAAYPDVVTADGSVHDTDRVDYLKTHIQAVSDAIDSGVDVTGYFVWSLLDNFEWGWGYSKRFGIVRVDYESLSRTVKDSGRWYQGFLAA